MSGCGWLALQGSILPGRYSKVSTGQELLDQLGNSSARYIRVMSDITLPPDLGMRRITVSRLVQSRGCHQPVACACYAFLVCLCCMPHAFTPLVWCILRGEQVPTNALCHTVTVSMRFRVV